MLQIAYMPYVCVSCFVASRLLLSIFGYVSVLELSQNRELYRNRLTGPIPPELGKLKNLVSLDLYDNALTGSIPESLGNLRSLTFL